MRRVRRGSPADGKLIEGDALVEAGGANLWKATAASAREKLVGKQVWLVWRIPECV